MQNMSDRSMDRGHKPSRNVSERSKLSYLVDAWMSTAAPNAETRSRRGLFEAKNAKNALLERFLELSATTEKSETDQKCRVNRMGAVTNLDKTSWKGQTCWL